MNTVVNHKIPSNTEDFLTEELLASPEGLSVTELLSMALITLHREYPLLQFKLFILL